MENGSSCTSFRRIEVRMIQEVEEFGAELQDALSSERNALLERNVHVDHARPNNDVPSCVADGAWTRSNKCTRIKIQIRTAQFRTRRNSLAAGANAMGGIVTSSRADAGALRGCSGAYTKNSIVATTPRLQSTATSRLNSSSSQAAPRPQPSPFWEEAP